MTRVRLQPEILAWHTCGPQRKLCYESRREAEMAAWRLLVLNRERLRAYQCPHCRHWHLTHEARRTSRG